MSIVVGQTGWKKGETMMDWRQRCIAGSQSIVESLHRRLHNAELRAEKAAKQMLYHFCDDTKRALNEALRSRRRIQEQLEMRQERLDYMKEGGPISTLGYAYGEKEVIDGEWPDKPKSYYDNLSRLRTQRLWAEHWSNT